MGQTCPVARKTSRRHSVTVPHLGSPAFTTYGEGPRHTPAAGRPLRATSPARYSPCEPVTPSASAGRLSKRSTKTARGGGMAEIARRRLCD